MGLWRVLKRNASRSLLLVISLFALITSEAYAATLTGRIVSIADGDTVTLLDANLQQRKIRLSGIDAPERRCSATAPASKG